jgi:Bax protein
MKQVLTFVAAGVLAVEALTGLSLAFSQDTSDGETFDFSSYVDLERLLEKLGYTPEAWREGSRAVPRLYLTKIPERWRDKSSKEISISAKTQIFFRILAPLVLRANELVLADRARLGKISREMDKGKKPSEEDGAWLTGLARTYGVIATEETAVGESEIAELWNRVDYIPVSLALSQAAEESGWGASRFAAQGNSLFGQWTWKGEGITPEHPQSGKGDYKVASFKSPLASVEGYVQNLNTNAAYTSLRKERARLREEGKPITGTALARTLVKYSQRGEAYVVSLESIISYNKLAPTDSTYLKDMKPIYLVPVGPGVD